MNLPQSDGCFVKAYPAETFCDGHVAVSMAETKCARWRRKSVPVWLIKKGGDALGTCLGKAIGEFPAYATADACDDGHPP